MKKSFAELTAAIGSALLSMLGFSGCDGGIRENRCEYGVPQCDFKVDLTVVDESGKAVKGIRVTPSEQRLTYGKDPLYTDENGKAAGNYDRVWPYDEVKFYFDDVDGEANGSFKRDSLTVKAEKLKGGSGWYEGEFALKGTKTLKKDE